MIDTIPFMEKKTIPEAGVNVVDLTDLGSTSSSLNIEDITNLKNLTDKKLIEMASGDLIDHIQVKFSYEEFVFVFGCL